ncbi:MAG: hypothetical protein QM750_12820 [Rubrivivax sp.]
MSRHLRARAAALAAPSLAALLAAVLAPSAGAASFNVSQLVNGVAEPWPLYLPGTPTADCGANCLYVNSAAAGMSNSYDLTPGPYVVGGWPPAYAGGVPGLASVAEELAVPLPNNGQTMDGGGIGVHQRANVEFAWQPLLGGQRQMAVQSWKTGSGAGTVSYALRIQTPAAGAKRTYLEFRVPALRRGWQLAYTMGGPSGYEYIYTQATRLQTRSAVDVYVDGLPVWSSASNALQPKRFNPPGLNPLILDWDQPLVDDTVTLYLGTLPAGSVRSVAMVLRTDLRTEAPTCKNSHENGTTYQRCHSQREAISLPADSVSSGGPLPFISYRPAVRVYTR